MSVKPNHDLIYRKVPEYLRIIRTRAGLTQRELAQKVQKTQWWVARNETGSRRVDVAEFVRICTACSVDPKKALDDLL